MTPRSDADGISLLDYIKKKKRDAPGKIGQEKREMKMLTLITLIGQQSSLIGSKGSAKREGERMRANGCFIMNLRNAF
jgi:hypothetical protein